MFLEYPPRHPRNSLALSHPADTPCGYAKCGAGATNAAPAPPLTVITCSLSPVPCSGRVGGEDRLLAARAAVLDARRPVVRRVRPRELVEDPRGSGPEYPCLVRL